MIFSQGNLLERSLQGLQSTAQAVTHTQHTLVFLCISWQMFTLKFTVPIQIYNTLEGVSMEHAQIQLLISF